MGVPKGTDNFKSHRSDKQSLFVSRIKAELEKLDRRKIKYENARTLVADLSERLGIHRTTFGRNPKYEKLVMDFLARQPGASTFVANEDATPELLRAKLLDADMNLGLLQDQMIEREKAATKVASASAEPAKLSVSEAHLAYADTVWAMRAVIDRVNAGGDLLEIDMDKGEIRDLASAPGRQVIVSGPRLRPFLDALRRLKAQEQ